jgi:hypothetical protein
MRSFSAQIWMCFVAASVLYAQNTPAPAQANEIKGMPPRATPGDYPAHIQVGNITIAAEFTGHSVPRPEDPLSTDDYIIVEACLFGPPGARLTLSPDDFSMRINDKKPQTSQPFVVVASSLRDPEWVPPDQPKAKSKTSFGGGGGASDTATLPPKIPIELQRSMTQYIRKAALPEGDRPLPAAGLLFFQYHGKVQNIRFLQLIYSGPAGKATLELQP